jgi:hypothetical protein
MRTLIGSRKLFIGGQTVLILNHLACGLKARQRGGCRGVGQVVNRWERRAISQARASLHHRWLAANAASRNGNNVASGSAKLTRDLGDVIRGGWG